MQDAGRGDEDAHAADAHAAAAAAAAAATAAGCAPDVAEAAAAAAYEPPHVEPAVQLPRASAADAPGGDSDDDGFEFGSDAAASDSSSWASSDEETGEPVAAGAIPAWLARRGAAGRRA